MANYYSESSVIVPCGFVSATNACIAFDLLNNEMSEATLSMIESSSETNLTALEKIIRHSYRNHPDYILGERLQDYAWSFEVSVEGESEEKCAGLWVGSSDNFNSEHASVFLQAVLKAFDLPDLLEIEVSHSCSRLLPDGFGGHALVVTKDYIRYWNAQKFFNAESLAHKTASRYFLCSITEADEKHECQKIFLMQCGAHRDPNALLMDRCNRPSPDGTGIRNPDIIEIEPCEFETMKQYLPVDIH